jgi:hypothetical protein
MITKKLYTKPYDNDLFDYNIKCCLLPKEDIATIHMRILEEYYPFGDRIFKPIQLIVSEICLIILKLNRKDILNLNQEEINEIVLQYYQSSNYKHNKVNENTRTLYVNKMIFNIIDRNIDKLNEYTRKQWKSLRISKKYKNKTTKQFIKYMAIQAIHTIQSYTKIKNRIVEGD